MLGSYIVEQTEQNRTITISAPEVNKIQEDYYSKKRNKALMPVLFIDLKRLSKLCFIDEHTNKPV